MRSPFATLLFSVALVTSACSNSERETARADSALARDLALASANTPQPTFEDTSLAPAPAPAKIDTPAPARRRPVQQPQREVPRPAPQPAPQREVAAPVVVQQATIPTPAPERGAIAGGSTGVLTIGSKVCSSTNMVGDKLVATLNEPLTGTHGAILPAGSTVVLEVASVQSGDKAENAQITFRVRSIVVNDKTYTVAADATPESALDRAKVQGTDPNADKKKVIGGAIAGAVLGQMIGRNTKGTVIGAAAGAAAGAAVAKSGEKWEACLPSGAQVRLKLNEVLVLS
jgi:hypothetical protein